MSEREAWFETQRPQLPWLAPWRKPVHWKGHALVWGVTLAALALLALGYWMNLREDGGGWLIGSFLAVALLYAGLLSVARRRARPTPPKDIA